MKNIILFLCICVVYMEGLAQHDSKFYYPNKELKPIEDTLKHAFLSFKVEQDTLTTLTIKPEKDPKATIIFFQGAGGNATYYVDYIKPLVAADYQVVLVNFRGYGKSTGTPTHVNIRKDAQIIFDSLLKRVDFSHQKIIVYGVSIGTQIAVNLTMNNQDKIDGLILDGAMSSFTDIAVATSPKAMQGMIRKQVTSPYAAKEDITKIDSIPLLMIHSKEDSSIPFEQSQKIYENANQPKTFWIYEGDHLQVTFKHPEEFVKRVNDLYAQ